MTDAKPKASLMVKLLIIPATILAVYLTIIGKMSSPEVLSGEAVGAGFGPVLLGLVVVGVMQVSKVNRNKRSRYRTFLIIQGVFILLQIKVFLG